MMIVFEGIDASGKATQSKLMAEALGNRGRSSAIFSFPRYSSEVGGLIKKHLLGHATLVEERHSEYGDIFHVRSKNDALAFQCFMVADKYAAAPEISRCLKVDDVDVICDRWWPSALAYGLADGLSESLLFDVHASLPPADLYFLLDVDPGTARTRRPDLGDRYEQDRAKQRDVRHRYLTLWQRREKEAPGWHTIDANRTTDKVHASCMAIVEQHLAESKLKHAKLAVEERKLVDLGYLDLRSTTVHDLSKPVVSGGPGKVTFPEKK